MKNIVFLACFAIFPCYLAAQSCLLDSMGHQFNTKLYGEPRLALMYAKQFDSISNEEKDFWHIALAKNYIGMSYNVLNDYENALTYFYKSLALFTKLSQKKQEAVLYNNLGTVYNNLGNPTKTIEMYQNALAIFQSIQDSTWIPKVLYNLSTQYNSLKNFEKDIDLKKQALQILEKKPNDNLKLTIIPNYAHSLYTSGKSLEAKTMIELYFKDNSYPIAPSVLSNAYITYSFILDTLGNLNQAIKMCETAKNIAIKNELLFRQQKCYKELAKLYEKKKWYPKALENLKLYQSLYAKENNETKEQVINDLVIKYETKQKEDKIELLSTQNQLQSIRIQKSFNQKLILGILLLGCLILLGFFYYLNKIKTNANKQLNVKNEQISSAIEEKNTLLREIHHRVKNNLQVISSLLKLQSQYITDENAIKAIADGRNRVNSMALLHKNLYKEDNLTGVDMKEYFTNLIETLFETYNIKSDQIKLYTEISEVKLDIDTVIPLGLITNELISNALKHAFHNIQDASLEVKLWESNDKLYLAVNDNGVGQKSNDKGLAKESFGQTLITALSEKLEADVSVNANKGTRVLLCIREYKKIA
ncbi:MAG: histidine kinase dimerization/phosphoacceptor domain -containing protein [Saprospiraceae bacterium]